MSLLITAWGQGREEKKRNSASFTGISMYCQDTKPPPAGEILAWFFLKLFLFDKPLLFMAVTCIQIARAQLPSTNACTHPLGESCPYYDRMRNATTVKISACKNYGQRNVSSSFAKHQCKSLFGRKEALSFSHLHVNTKWKFDSKIWKLNLTSL